MGKYRIALIGLFALLTAQFGHTQSLNWDYTNIQDDIRLSGVNPDMKVDANGRIHISYWDRETDQLIYTYRDAGTSTWIMENVSPTRPCGFQSSLEIANDGEPRIAFLENDNGNSQIRYAFRTPQGIWSVETIPGSFARGHWGEYGFTGPNNFTERIKPDLDLVLKQGSEPQILFFDAWMNPGAFPACDQSSNYGWKMHQAYRQSGVWKTKATLGELPDKHAVCAGDSLPKGDRYGEYPSFLQRKDGSLVASAISRWNGEVIMLNDSAGKDTIWKMTVLDSLERARPAYTWAYEWFTMEGVSMHESADSVLHLAYTTSLFYGENFCCTYPDPLSWGPWVTTMVYARVYPDTVIYRDFGSVRYRNHTSITTKGTDTTFIAYADLGYGAVMLMDSVENDTATIDTFYTASVTSSMPMEVVGDSVHILLFDELLQRLILAKRHVNGGSWVYEVINRSENLATTLDGAVWQQTGDTSMQLAYNDAFNGILYHAEGTKNGAWNWNIQEIDPTKEHFSAISYENGPNNEPTVLYGSGVQQLLTIAIKNGATWQYEILDTNDFVTYSQVALDGNDTLHIAWYDANDRCLKYGKRAWTGGTWSFDIIDCGYDPVGQYPSLKIGTDNLPRIAYYHELDLALKYAAPDPVSRAWNIETAYVNTPSPVGKYASMELTSANLPVIAFLDEQRTSVYITERNASGVWDLTLLDSSSVFNMGRPIELELDKFDNPWVAYNTYSNYDRIKLLHRDSIWRAVSVSTQGRIANSFRFRIVDNDLYIFGKKNAPGNTGIAMLYAGNGLFIANDDPLITPENISMEVFPNPLQDRTTIRYAIESPGQTSLRLLDIMGREIQIISPAKFTPGGTHSIQLGASGLPSGIYLVQLRKDELVQMHKIMIAD